MWCVPARKLLARAHSRAFRAPRCEWVTRGCEPERAVDWPSAAGVRAQRHRQSAASAKMAAARGRVTLCAKGGREQKSARPSSVSDGSDTNLSVRLAKWRVVRFTRRARRYPGEVRPGRGTV